MGRSRPTLGECLSIGFRFQSRVGIEPQPPPLCPDGYSSLLLLNNMPGLVWQVPFLAPADIDVASLCISQRVNLGRFGRIVVDSYVVHGESGQNFDTAFQLFRQTRLVTFVDRRPEIHRHEGTYLGLDRS